MMIFSLADRLHKTAGEILAIPVEELIHWLAYLELQQAKKH